MIELLKMQLHFPKEKFKEQKLLHTWTDAQERCQQSKRKKTHTHCRHRALCRFKPRTGRINLGGESEGSCFPDTYSFTEGPSARP